MYLAFDKCTCGHDNLEHYVVPDHVGNFESRGCSKCSECKEFDKVIVDLGPYTHVPN